MHLMFAGCKGSETPNPIRCAIPWKMRPITGQLRSSRPIDILAKLSANNRLDSTVDGQRHALNRCNMSSEVRG
jgi:hypothetical protein